MRTSISLNKQIGHQEIIVSIERMIQKFIQDKGSQDLSGALLIMEIKDTIPYDNTPKITCGDCTT
jgi:hypothetical protein